MLDRHAIPFIAVDADAGMTSQARSDGKPVYYGDAARPEFPARLRARDGARGRRHHGLDCGQRGGRRDDAAPKPGHHAGRPRPRRRSRRALYALGVTDAVPETIEASLQLSEAVLVDLGVPMGLVIASIHEKRDEFRKLLAAAGAPNRPRSTRGPRRG